MTLDPRETATQLIDPRSGTEDGRRELLESLYGELRQLARSLLQGERSTHTLQPTALVHEAWVRLVDCAQLEAADQAEAQRRFYHLASKAMRNVLVDHARHRGRQKRGGDRKREILADVPITELAVDDLLDIETVIEELEKTNPVVAQVAELRIFAGLQIAEIADTVQTSTATVKRYWALARALLSKQFDGIDAAEDDAGQ